MSLTFEQAHDEVLALFKTAWDTTGYLAHYQDVRTQRQVDDDPYAAVFSGGLVGFQSTLSSATGAKRFRRDTFIIIQLFTPSGKGLSERNNLAKVITDAFEGVSNSNGIWVRDIRVDAPIRDGKFAQTNITIEFTYDEVK